MKVSKTNIKGCYVFELTNRGDHRGYFEELYKESAYKMHGVLTHWPQDNFSFSVNEGTFRGMHYQKGDAVQGKLVTCVSGIVIDYIYDARIGSPTYGKWEKVIIDGNSMNPAQVYVPEGCLHGFYVAKGKARFIYKCTNEYNAQQDAGVRCTDPALGLELPKGDFILSDKDKNLPLLKDAELDFIYQPRCVVTGAITGQLGPDVVKELTKRGYKDILVLDKEILDLTDAEKVKEVIGNFDPDVIFHCAAFTDVDLAQRKPDLATAVNVDATTYITEVANKCNSKLIYISTDYVYDGKQEKGRSYKTTDTPSPMGVYGQTKLEGENVALNHDKAFVVRTSCVFGDRKTNNFVRTMFGLYGKHQNIPVVDDQIGSPTYTKDLAKFLVSLSETDKYGIYNGTNKGACSRYELACKIFEYASRLIANPEFNTTATPISTEDYYNSESMLKKIRTMLIELGFGEHEVISPELMSKVISPRPLNATLDQTTLAENGFDELRPWSRAVEECVMRLALEKMEENA